MQNEETKPPPLNKAKFFTSSFFIHNSAFVLVALLALVIRLPSLSVRPMHTDESVNAYITGSLLTGEKYHYDPQDRHGPILYLVAKPFAQLCGAKNLSELTETQLRLVPVIIGSAMILLFGAAVNMFGFLPCLIAALLFAVAPLPVYYSRYFIHETLFVAATFGLMLSGWRTLKTGSLLFAALSGLLAAVMLACKETAVIHFFALALALVAVRFGAPSTRSARTDNGHQLAEPVLRVPSAKIVFAAFTVFIIATILLFTWFGQNWSALGDLVHAVSRFTARAGGEGHEKPFAYYFQLLDPLLVLSFLVVAGMYVAICDAVSGARKAGLLMAIYGLVSLLIYSCIPYKTPWLALNFWLPFALLSGVGLSAILDLIKNSAGRRGAMIAGLFLLATLGAQTKELCFDKPADEKNPLAYAHTGEDLLRLPERLDELAQQKNLANPRICVVLADAWPLPWYLRKFSNVGFWQPDQEIGAADFIITSSDTPDALLGRLKDARPEFFGARPGVLLILWPMPASDRTNEASAKPALP